MSKWISPQQLYDDPKLWLSVNHQFHETLGKLMAKMFPDWAKRLQEYEVVCLECAGTGSIPGVTERGKKIWVTGYVKKPELLLHTIERH